MNSLIIETQEACARSVAVSEDSLTVDLVDGHTIIVPLVWYPRLWYGSAEERNNYEIIGVSDIFDNKHKYGGYHEKSLKYSSGPNLRGTGGDPARIGRRGRHCDDLGHLVRKGVDPWKLS